ncbi:fumarylacetoacetate hydrolase family protein [Thermosulfuriphilus ammonigenes]|uniref:Fumarylacetoacetate hydrolase family protein n=1 Tax=Thermosulfuriphilus ammonigenes TaxID=1936021 RepID=A0A6G7PVZ5_9BACT|nr:fumarylacetoacetate hydrolase family protein [Thermosulfuriphilus ammonigenes]MBA2848211.1 2-keto-4-pentenoate hydratase/2-oxohepta-3-ene-1,7-dioic acid hydratase in catechol pathway [Thermosulfuriphilus ammonigenes]QIJ71618.1 fumarylacetoacetate hydrolase family protein [Thermosulfuriphilus ammonigenes]
MKIIRFLYQGQISYGILEDQKIEPLKTSPYEGFNPTGDSLSLNEVQLLTPSIPSKIIALGLNYRDHAAELGMPLPKEPLIFLKPSTAAIGPGQAIVYPSMSQRVDYEAELAIVIGRQAKGVSPDKALDFVLGYTCFNDVTARDLQKKDGQWTRAKSFDTFAPMGPWIETDLDPDNLLVEAYLNGRKCQSSRTSQLVFSVPEIISFVSQVMTLLPGDVIATGTPPGIGPMKPGDTIEIRIEGIGSLINHVVKEGG